MITSDVKRICIVTPDYLSSTPRVVKEADALTAAGYDVRVVCAHGDLSELRQRDAVLHRNKRWRMSVVGWSASEPDEHWLNRWSWWRYHAVRALCSWAVIPAIVAHTQSRVYRELAEQACAQEADLFIGHYPAGLAAAGLAAGVHHASLGYDFEDWYIGQYHEDPRQRAAVRWINAVERRYVPGCRHLTASSTGIAAEVARHYAVAMPTIVHNAFPWADRESIDGKKKDRRDKALSLYWYSQVIGEGRGIEDAVRAAGLLGGDVELHLRGECSPRMRDKLTVLAASCGIHRNLYIHRPVSPDELLSRAVEHDVGLALETTATVNHGLAASNKLFSYLLAGLAVAVSDTPGQMDILRTCSGAGFFYPSGDHRRLAELLTDYKTNRELLNRSKAASLAAAHDRWNWERESQHLINVIRREDEWRKAV